jgi:N-acyl homoserine lactone hydrolase
MYTIDVLVQGFPGKAVCHGGLGWSTVTLIRGAGRVVLLDVGAFGVRRELLRQLQACGVAPGAVTDVVLTHAHYDHAVNFTLFPEARIWIGAAELAWAAGQPPGFDPLPELYVRELDRSPRVRRIAAGDEFLPGFHAIAAPGHTPGHLVFLLRGCETPVLFSGDAAKNRAELLDMQVDASEDRQQSRASLEVIWRHWRAEPGTLLVPGHDLCMRLDDDGQPRYVGQRQAAISAWFSQTLAEQTTIDLCAEAPRGLFTPLLAKDSA